MTQIITVVVIVLLILVVAYAIRGKSIFTDINRVKEKINKGKPGNVPPKTKLPYTDQVALLYMHQLDKHGKSIYVHEIDYGMIVKDDEMVGVTVSRPNADSDGIRLYARKNETKDPAFTVNSDAVYIAMDDVGFYLQTCNPRARVFKLGKNKELINVPNGCSVAITDGTRIRIGAQWLLFKEPEDEILDDICDSAESSFGTVRRTTPGGRVRGKSVESDDIGIESTEVYTYKGHTKKADDRKHGKGDGEKKRPPISFL